MTMDAITKILASSPRTLAGLFIVLLSAFGVILYPYFTGTAFATEAFVREYVDCRGAPDSVRLIKMSIRDLEKEASKFPGSATLREELLEEKDDLMRLKKIIHSEKCRR